MLEMEKYINITFTESDQPIFPSLHKNFTCTVRSHAKPLLIMQFLGIDFFFFTQPFFIGNYCVAKNYDKLILAISQCLVIGM